MKIKLNSNLFPIISVGMYNSLLSSENMFSDYQIDEDKTEGYIYFNSEYFNDNFDNSKYVKAIENLAKNFLSDAIEVDGIKLTIETGEIYSPKFYNFSTDEIDLTVTFDKNKVLKFAKENQETFDAFLKENYSSYDGFSSSTANNFFEWYDDFKSNNEQSIGAILTYIFCDNDDSFYDEDAFYYYCSENLFYSEFVNCESIDKEVEELEAFVKENYNTIDVNNLPSFEFEHLDTDSIKKIVFEVMAQIENNTISLF